MESCAQSQSRISSWLVLHARVVSASSAETSGTDTGRPAKSTWWASLTTKLSSVPSALSRYHAPRAATIWRALTANTTGAGCATGKARLTTGTLWIHSAVEPPWCSRTRSPGGSDKCYDSSYTVPSAFAFLWFVLQPYLSALFGSYYR